MKRWIGVYKTRRAEVVAECKKKARPQLINLLEVPATHVHKLVVAEATKDNRNGAG